MARTIIMFSVLAVSVAALMTGVAGAGGRGAREQAREADATEQSGGRAISDLPSAVANRLPHSEEVRRRLSAHLAADSPTTSQAEQSRGIPDMPCDDCGTGAHWIHDPPCFAGQDLITTKALVALDTDFDCLPDINLVLFDTSATAISRSNPLDESNNFPGTGDPDGHFDVLDTEINFMSLTDQGFQLFLTAGEGRDQAGQILPSLGAIVEDPDFPARANSFFDVFFEADIGGALLYNQVPVRVETPIDCVAPKAQYLHITGCTELFTSPIPGEGEHLMNLVSAEHETFPDPCPNLGDCCEVHTGRGCEDPSCCQQVCAADPSCCSTSLFFAWTEACAEIAQSLCPVCRPLGTTYSIGLGVRPEKQKTCRSVTDPAFPGEPDNVVIFRGFPPDFLGTLTDGTIPEVRGFRSPLGEGVTGLFISIVASPGGDLSPLPPGQVTGDICLDLGLTDPIDIAPDRAVLGAHLSAFVGPNEVGKRVLDPGMFFIDEAGLSATLEIPGVADQPVSEIFLQIDLGVVDVTPCEPTEDGSSCKPAICPGGQVCLPTGGNIALVSTCECIEPKGCRFDVGPIDDPACGGNCPVCQSCKAFDQILVVSCSCARIGNATGNASNTLREFGYLANAFGKKNVPTTTCEDANGNGAVELGDLRIVVDNLHGPAPYVP